MLQDIPHMTADEIYAARFEIAGFLVQTSGLVVHLSKDVETRPESVLLRRELEAAQAAFERVLRP